MRSHWNAKTMYLLCNSPPKVNELDKMDLINKFKRSKTLNKEPHHILKLTEKGWSTFLRLSASLLDSSAMSTSFHAWLVADELVKAGGHDGQTCVWKGGAMREMERSCKFCIMKIGYLWRRKEDEEMVMVTWPEWIGRKANKRGNWTWLGLPI